jgi:micrococcal nuclease
MGNLFGSRKDDTTYSQKKMISDTNKFSTKSINLNSATMKNVDWFKINDIAVQAKVVKVYDGDTCTCVFDTLGLGLYKHSIRLVGIDTPEIRGKTPEEKIRAKEVRDFVRELILDKIVQLQCKGSDKYGRILGIITTDQSIVVNDLLVDNGMAIKYDGGKKTEFDFSKPAF